MKQFALICLIFLSLTFNLSSQPWVLQNSIFNPSGVPSLPFSQPRFADIDADGDHDMIIGNTSGKPFFVENTGTALSPAFNAGPDIFSVIDPLDAEMGVFYDLDADGDLDFVSGGFTGLNLFNNIGDANNPVFEKVSGFFNGLNVGQIPVPDLADVDADGDADMIVGFSESGLLRLYMNTGSAVSASFSETNGVDVDDVGLYAYPVFCDLDADGDIDLISGRDGHNLWFYENTGTTQISQWDLNTLFFNDIGSQTYWNSPSFVDLNADETFDLVYGTADGPLNYYVNSGTPQLAAWTMNASLFGGVLDPGGASNPCLYDFDNDGDLDLLSGSQLGSIYYYENTGTASGPAWNENSTYFASIDHSIYSAVAAGDVNSDGLVDVIVGDLSGKLYYHRNTGLGFELVTDVLQSITLSGWSSPRLLDLDQDGDLDIIAGEENGKLSYLRNNGTAISPDWQLIAGFFGSFDIGSNCVPALTDLDFDGDIDILCGGMFGDLKYLQNNNGVWTQNNMVIIGLNAEQNAAPFFGDLDNDGDADLVLGEYSGVFSYYRNDFLFVTIPETTLSAKSVNAFPNPVSNEVTIEFYLEETSSIELQLIDYTGKVIWKKPAETRSKGKHSIQIKGVDFPKGVNILQLNSGKRSEVIKILRF